MHESFTEMSASFSAILSGPHHILWQYLEQ